MKKAFQIKTKPANQDDHSESRLQILTQHASEPVIPPKFSWFQKAIILTILFLGLLFSSTVYSAGPDILNVEPKKHEFGKVWEMSKSGQLKTLAMLIEMYPDHDLYFLDRDARLLGQTGLLIGEIEKDPSLKSRIHFLNVSRKNIKDPLLNEYLKQEGISTDSLAQGKKVLFIDTGFIGSLPRHMISLFPKHKDQFNVHMIVAAADDREDRNPFPSTRVFGTEFSETYPNQDIFDSYIDVVHQYARLPKSDLRSDYYVKDPNGKIIPESHLGSRDQNDGEINPIKTRQYEEDLSFYMRDSNHRLLLDKLRREWRTAHSLWKQGKKNDLINELKRWVTAKGPQGLAMAMDFIEMNHTTRVGDFTLTPQDVGINPQEFNYNEEKLIKSKPAGWRFKPCRALLKSVKPS